MTGVSRPASVDRPRSARSGVYSARFRGVVGSVLGRLLGPLGYTVQRKQPKLTKPAQVFSIGMYQSADGLAFSDLPGVTNPVLTAASVTDIPARFVADPFLVHADSVWYMFFEVLERRTGLGRVGLATSRDLIHWAYERIVLAEPFHLSYPHVFRWHDDFYLIPETGQTRSIRLYRAREFPCEWDFVETLASGLTFLDATPFQWNDRWWMFCETNPGLKFDTLRLLTSTELTCGWREHPLSPVVRENPTIARPAGRVMTDGDSIVRFGQDCRVAYGSHVHAMQVTALSPTGFAEEAMTPGPILTGSGYGWNAGGMHHVDLQRVEGRAGWIACVDGWCLG